MNEKLKLQLKINRARYNLMFMAILSAINIVTVFASSKIIMPFSSAISTYSAVFCLRFANTTGNDILRVIGIGMAILIITFILFCYFKSKDKDIYIAFAFGFTVADTVCLICFSAFAGYLLSMSTFLDIALHILTIVYLFGALTAFRKLSKCSEENAENTEKANKDDELEEYIDNGEQILLEADYDGYNIVIAEGDECTLLIVNGYICNTTEAPITQNYELSALVNDVDINFVYSESENGTAYCLYADGNLIAESDT